MPVFPMNDYHIYLSYFKVSAENPNSKSICPRTPPWYVMGRAEDVMCSKELYDLYFKKCAITQEDFYKEYVRQTLSKLNPWEILEKYRGTVFLGYYKKGTFDCRNMFGKWIKETTGIVLPELDTQSLAPLFPVF